MCDLVSLIDTEFPVLRCYITHDPNDIGQWAH